MISIRIMITITAVLALPACTKDQDSKRREHEPRATAHATTESPAIQAHGPARIVQVTAGDDHTCALTDQGTVRCWGQGADGRLGYGNTNSIGDDEPASAAGDIDLGGKAVQVSAGEKHTCALLQGGKVRCWGSGEAGRLGYGNTNSIGDDETPASAGDVPVGGEVMQLAAVGERTCAVMASGKVRCWGEGDENMLGYGKWGWRDIGDDETPAALGDVLLEVPATKVALEYGTSCALLRTQAVRCWGPRWGQEATRDWEPRRLPDVEIGAKVRDISAGDGHTCVVLAERDAIRCWGGNHHGELGHANDTLVYPHGPRSAAFVEDFQVNGDEKTAADMGDVPVGSPVIMVAAGGEHTCAIIKGGKVRCWGSARFGQLGHGNTTDIGIDVPVASAGDVDLGGTALQVAAGTFHTCALLDTGKVRCWGWGKDGRLGYGHTRNIGDDETPASAGDVPAL